MFVSYKSQGVGLPAVASSDSAAPQATHASLSDQPRPAWGAAALLGLLLLVLLASQFLGRPLAAYAVGVVGIEVGAMFAYVGETGLPLNRPSTSGG